MAKVITFGLPLESTPLTKKIRKELIPEETVVAISLLGPDKRNIA